MATRTAGEGDARVTFGDVAFSAAGVPVNTGPYEALLVGASLGGPPAVEAILAALPRDFPIPVAICQHMPPGFTAAWAERLNEHCSLNVTEPHSVERFRAGNVYVAPIGQHLRFMRHGDHTHVRLDDDFSDSLHVPSIDIMMSSAAQIFGSCTLAVILTGMGHDGTTGMLAVRQAGGYTIGEAQSSAVSYSMPGSAASAGAIVEQLDLAKIPARVVELGSVAWPTKSAL